MKVRTAAAIFAARSVRFGLRILGKGATTLPGKVALYMDSELLSHLAEGKKIIVITGTNGKTTTTHMIGDTLADRGYAVVSNVSGANLATGVATSMLEGLPIEKKAKRENRQVVYVLEVDEAAFGKINGKLTPKVQVVTNLFRDQLDRYGEILTTRDFITNGLKGAKGKILLNSDDSMVASLGKEREGNAVFFGMNSSSMESITVTKGEKKKVTEGNSDASFCIFCQSKYEYRARSFGHLGEYCCPSCGFSRPDPSFSFSFSPSWTDPQTGKKISPSEEDYPVLLEYNTTGFLHGELKDTDCSAQRQIREVRTTVPGLHNFYNLMCAAAACTLFGEEVGDEGLDFSHICEGLQSARPAFGRMEKIVIGDKKLCLLLVKNPIGLERALSILSEVSDAGSAYFLLNSNIADGKDISWIWDVNFEDRHYPKALFVSGERYGDMLLRLVYAGVKKENIQYSPIEDSASLMEKALETCQPGECLYILPNYTSMLYLRGIMEKKYNLKAFWK